MKRNFTTLLAALILITTLLAACASPAALSTPTSLANAPAEPTLKPTEAVAKATEAIAKPVETSMGTVELPEVDPGLLTGNIIIAGSSTVYPLSEAMAERFIDEGFTEDRGKITISSIGSGAGFERFCKTGETDISNASRGIKDSEVESCKAINRTPIEFRVGTDALAVVVSQDNTFLTDVTIEELAKLFSKDAVKWSDVNPAWPNEDIKRFSPGTDSGTYDFFVEAVMQKAYEKEAAEKAILDAQNIQFSEDDNVLVQGVLGSPYAIGYFGYAYFEENAGSLKTVAVDGISPSFETAEDGSYPLSRPLFVYSDATILQQKPQVAAFLNFFLTYVNEEIEAAGYFPASPAALDAARQNWLDAMKADEAMAKPAETSMSTVELPEVDPGLLTGNIIIAGSSTVYPLSEAMAERFIDEGFTEDKGKITISSIGSGAGFERFCKTGETDISNASRGIKDSEVESCKAINRTPIEFRVGTDALAVVVSQDNTFLTDVTIEELAKLFSKDAVKWSDVNPAWPNEDIKRFSPGTDSGTYDFFVEAVMQKAYEKEAAEKAILDAQNIQFSEDDNVLVQGVLGSPYAIGYFGYAYFEENAGSLKTVAVDGISPSFETAEDGSYPLSRPLFVYSDATILQQKPQVAAFLNFFLTYVNEEIEAAGYFPASPAALDAARQNWLDAMK